MDKIRSMSYLHGAINDTKKSSRQDTLYAIIKKSCMPLPPAFLPYPTKLPCPAPFCPKHWMEHGSVFSHGTS